MADEVGTAYVAVEADTSSFEASVQAAGESMASTLGSSSAQAGAEMESSMGGSFQRIGETAAGVLGARVLEGAATAVADFATGSIKAAAEDAEAQQRLALTLENVTGATKDQVAANEDYISSLSKQTAIADDDLRPAMNNLVRGFGNVEDAQKALALATDISVGTGKDLTSVSRALMLASQGQMGGLSRLGVATKNAAGETMSLTEVMDEAQRMFGGQAARSAGTAAGEIRNMQIQFGEFQEELGTAVLPLVTTFAKILSDTLLPALSVIAQIVQANSGWLGPLAIAIAAVVAGVKLWTIAQAAFNAVMAANPIVLVAVAIAALVAGIIWAYQNVEWFREAVDAMADAVVAAFEWILDIVTGVWDWIKDHWPLLLAILTGPIGGAVLLITTYWDQIKGAVMAVWQWIIDHWQLLLGIFLGPFVGIVAYVVSNWSQISDKVRGVVDAVIGFFVGLADKLIAPFRAAVDWVVNTWGQITSKVGEVVTGVGNKVGELLTMVRELPGKIVEAFGNAGRLLYDIGRQIISGLIDGIKSMAGSAVDAVKNVGGSIVGGAKKLFGIGSPSKVFIDIGHDVQLGLAKGIEGYAGLSLAAVDSSLGALTAANAGAAGAGAPAIDARLVNNGTIYGVDDLDAWADQRDRKLALVLAGGRR